MLAVLLLLAPPPHGPSTDLLHDPFAVPPERRDFFGPYPPDGPPPEARLDSPIQATDNTPRQVDVPPGPTSRALCGAGLRRAFPGRTIGLAQSFFGPERVVGDGDRGKIIWNIARQRVEWRIPDRGLDFIAAACGALYYTRRTETDTAVLVWRDGKFRTLFRTDPNSFLVCTDGLRFGGYTLDHGVGVAVRWVHGPMERLESADRDSLAEGVDPATGRFVGYVGEYKRAAEWSPAGRRILPTPEGFATSEAGSANGGATLI